MAHNAIVACGIVEQFEALPFVAVVIEIITLDNSEGAI